jgi:hypothetical protein
MKLGGVGAENVIVFRAKPRAASIESVYFLDGPTSGILAAPGDSA